MDYEQMIPERYRVTYINGVFKILDTWHESIKNINDMNMEIPDNSPAMTLISTEQISALMTKLKEIGWLDKYATKVVNTNQKVQPKKEEDIRSVAITNITTVTVATDVDPSLAKEAISAIKSIAERG